jgi:hypothetical protein
LFLNFQRWENPIRDGLEKFFFMLRKVYYAGCSALLLFATMWIVSACKDDDKFVPLKVNSVSPAQAIIGDTITLEGEGFSPGIKFNYVSFSGLTRHVLPLTGSTTSKLLIAVPDSAQSGPLHINILNDEIFDTQPLTVLTPIFGSIEPTTGNPGDTIVITGENFSPNAKRNNVTFNPADPLSPANAYATVLSSSHTELKVIIPVDARTGNISVQGYPGPKFIIKGPEITKLSTQKGIVGDTIMIYGSGLNTSAEFSFQNAAAVPLEGSTSREIKISVPPGATDGKVRLRYMQGDTPVEIQSDSAFLVYPSITRLAPPNGAVGTPLTILGYTLSPKPGKTAVVTINGRAIAPKNITDTEVDVMVPFDATSGPVTVKVNGRLAIGPVFNVVSSTALVVNSITPDEGATVGSVVTISGNNFSATPAENTVTFKDGRQAVVQSATKTKLTVEVPAGAVTGIVSVTVAGVTASSALPYTILTGGSGGPKINTISFNEATGIVSLTGEGFDSDKHAVTLTFLDVNNQGRSYGYKANTGYDPVTSISPTALSLDVYTLNPDPQQPDKRIACGDYLVTLRVTGIDEPSNQKNVTITGHPKIESVTPLEGEPGVEVTITGQQFNYEPTKNTILFGSTPATDVSGNVSGIKVKVPQMAAGQYNITLTAFGVSSSESFVFTVKQKDTKPENVKNIYLLGRSSQVHGLYKLTYGQASPKLIYKPSETATAMVFDLTSATKKAYFADRGDDTASPFLAQTNLDGTALKKLYTDADVYDLSLDATGGYLYWSSTLDDKIYRGKFSDTPPATPELLFKNLQYAYSLTYLPGNDGLYFSDGFDNTTTGDTEGRIRKGNVTTKAVTTLFESGDGLQFSYDFKIDETGGKLYILSTSPTGSWTISQANLDGSGAVQTLKEFDASIQVFSISLDLKDGYIYWSQTQNGQSTIHRALLSFGVIPNTSPAVSEQELYTGLDFGSTDDGGGSIAVEESTGGGAAQRVAGTVRTTLKYRRHTERK